MTIQRELARAAPPKETLLTIGVFDGVHRGHRHLLNRLKGEAARRGFLAGVLTFRNHPRTVLNSSARMSSLTSPEERQELLRALGIELVVTVDFTRELSLLRAQEFLLLLQEHLQMRGLVVGPDFALGHQREGDVVTLRALGQRMGFDVTVVKPLLQGGEMVKSSAIREAIACGDVERAARMLGRDFSLPGRVVKGAGRGRALGFPTANLAVDAGRATPGDGIYATWALVEGRRYPSATNIGVRPTFAPGERVIETHIIDFQGELYRRELQLEFVCRLREERAFASAQALVEQLARDVAQARAVLASKEKGSLAGRANPTPDN